MKKSYHTLVVKNKGFTLVELIVVITILAILGTIAVISLQGYSKSARDSSRITDLNNAKTSLELFALQTGYYPEPTGGTQVTYSGSEVWVQGTLGESVIGALQRFNKKPVDPLTGSEYTYSRLNTKKEFELGSIQEGDLSQITGEVYAAEKIATAYTTGNYNGVFAKTTTGTTTYILAVPSIIDSTLGDVKLENIITNKTLVYKGYGNIPAEYNNAGYTTTGETNLDLVDPASFVVFEGTYSSLIDKDDSTARDAMIANLKAAYTGSLVISQGTIAQILATDISNAGEITLLSSTLMNNILGTTLKISVGGDSGGAPAPTYFNIDGSTTTYLSDSANGSDRFEFTSGSSSGGISVVRDKITGLYWQSEGITQGSMTWDSAKTYCANLTLGGESDWRLPDYTELDSIVDFSSYDPAIDTNYFTANYTYWSATTYTYDTIYAWSVDFTSGSSYAGNKTMSYYVRCVR